MWHFSKRGRPNPLQADPVVLVKVFVCADRVELIGGFY